MRMTRSGFARAVGLALLLALAVPVKAGTEPGPAASPAKTDSAAAPPAGAPLKEVQVAASAFSIGDPVPSWIVPATIPDAGSGQSVVIRLADTQILVGDSPIVYSHYALAINDASSLNSAGQVPIQFVPQYQRLQLHAVHVIRGTETLDRTKSSTIRFLERDTGLEKGVYSDVVTASILVNDLRVGDTLEYVYSVSGENPVFAGKFVDTASWDQGFPTRWRRVILNHPAERKIFWQVEGSAQSKPLAPVEASERTTHKLTFEERDIAAVNEEPYTPSDYMPYRWINFSEFSGWDDVVAWAANLFQSGPVADADFRALVEKLKGMPSDEEKVVGALEFVQSEIRYFSVALGESSHRPTQPDIVLQHRYGDCKDKALLLVTILRELGIDSRPALLSLSRRKGLDRSLPSPQAFDHAIVQAAVGGKTYYLDATRLGQHGRLDRMGQAHDGVQALPIGPETHGLVTIVGAPVAERSETVETATLSKFGADGELKARQVWNGVTAEGLRVLYDRTPRERLAKSFADTMEQRYPGSKVVGEPEIDDDQTNNTFTITATYSVPKLAMERDGFWFVRYSPNNMAGTVVTPPSSQRTAPLQVPSFPFEAKYTFEVTFPDEVSITTAPHNQTVRSKYFVYTANSTFRGNVAKTTIGLKTLADRVETADLAKFTDELGTTDKAAPGVVIVPKNFIRSRKAVASKKKSLGQALAEQQKEAVDNATVAIKSGKLTGSDLAGAYCTRSAAYANLSKGDEALRDAGEALKLAPNSPDILSCRAEVYFLRGEFDKSAADYSKALSLGATDAKVFRQRGIAKFYGGKLDDAAEDFARANPGGDEVYSDIWLISAYQRLGKPLPDELLKRAGAKPRGDWPRPALAMLSGKLPPEQMVKLVEGKRGDDGQIAQAEGYFYLGQYYLTHGDAAKARTYFEKTRQINLATYVEHTAAGHELQSLKTRESVATGTLPPPAAAPLSRAVAPSAAAPEAKAVGAPAAPAPAAVAAPPAVPVAPVRPPKAAIGPMPELPAAKAAAPVVPAAEAPAATAPPPAATPPAAELPVAPAQPKAAQTPPAVAPPATTPSPASPARTAVTPAPQAPAAVQPVPAAKPAPAAIPDSSVVTAVPAPPGEETSPPAEQAQPSLLPPAESRAAVAPQPDTAVPATQTPAPASKGAGLVPETAPAAAPPAAPPSPSAAPPAAATPGTPPAAQVPKAARPKKNAKRIDPDWNTRLLH